MRTKSNIRDEGLAAGFAARERWAFAEAYRRYGALLYSAAYSVLGNADDAKDSVGDAIVRLWRSARPYDPARGNLRSFLTVCVRNDAISRLRRGSRRRRAHERLAAMTPERDESGFTDPIERDRVRRALLTLPPEQRAALELAYYQGKTQTEIAAELRAPLGTVKSRMRHGLERLAATMKASAGEAR